jgi:hypothetical protein
MNNSAADRRSPLLARKYPNADREWGCQWVFPASSHYLDQRTGIRHRHHLHGLHARVEPWRPRGPQSPGPPADACLRRDPEDHAHRPVGLRQWRKLEEWDRSGYLASTCDPGPPPAVLSWADQGPSYTGSSDQELDGQKRD